jgi:hypothetical protein
MNHPEGRLTVPGGKRHTQSISAKTAIIGRKPSSAKRAG